MITKENFFYLLKKYFWIFLLIGSIIYFPILGNGFVWDDYSFIINNPGVHQFNLQKLLGPSLFNSLLFYRPIPAIYFSLLYSLFADQAFYYHLIQLTLHLLCAFFLFIFLRTFFKNPIALILSLLFLVHPINVESVAFIGSTTSELFFLPGIIALVLSRDETLTKKKDYLLLAHYY